MPDAQSITQAIKWSAPVSFGAFTLGELNAVIRQNGVDFVGHGLCQIIEKVFGDNPCGARMKLGVGELRGSTATNIYSLPSSVCTSAMSIWK